MFILRETTRAIRTIFVLWLLTAVIYPALILAVAQVPFLQEKANGSIVYNFENQPIGSALIGQVFTSERYFQSRPSTTDYSQGEDAAPTGVSGASNYAPSNPELLKRVEETVKQLQEVGIQPTADLVYTSGSSLDPHITVDAALSQLERVARSRDLSTTEIEPLIAKHIEGRFLGIFGEPGVNVLNLNRELDVLQAPKQ